MVDNKKLQWKVKHHLNFTNDENFLDTILKDCGVAEDQIPGFMRPTKKYVNDPLLMTNMAEAVSMVHKHLKNNSKIFVKVDCDVDGFCSSAALIQFLQELNPEIQIDYMLNYEKKHGLTYQDMSGFTKEQYNLIIVPDASMTVRDARMITKNFSADILVLDHHLVENEFYDKATNHWVDRVEAKQIYSQDKERLEVDCYTNYCLAVNCTDGKYPNPTLCGAGVVQKFIEAYCNAYESTEDIPDCRESYLDLISLALIADSMDLRNLESRYYVMEGFKERNYNNEFINELVSRNEEDMKWGRYITSMGWNIAPKINGCIRYGKDDEQFDTFRAILGIKEDREYQPRRKHKDDPKPPVEIQTLQETMARVCENVKSRQDTEVRKFVKEIDKEISDKGLDKNSVLFVDGTKILEKGTVSGLIANRLASKYFRPVVLMRSKNALEFGGSGRNYAQGNIENLNDFLMQAGVNCAGHQSAFGVSFKKSELDNIIAKCNEMLPIDQLCTIHTVDCEIPANVLKRDFVTAVAENYAVWGSTVPEPIFAITNIKINASQITAYGENRGFIRFVHNGIVYVKKYCQYDDFDNMTLTDRNTIGANKKNLILNVIGQFTLSTWEDKVAPEIKILAFDSSEDLGKTVNQEDDWDFETSIKKPVVDDDFDW